MKHIKLFNSQTEAISLVCETPLVTTIKDMTDHVLYASSNVGEEVEIIENEDIDGFINYQKYVDGPANNEIWYTATAKLTETTDTSGKSAGLHTSLFNTTISNHTFDEATGEGIITFNEDVTTLNNYAFYSCSSLTSITLPDSVTSIGNYAFRKCTGLTSIVIPDSVTSIGECAFDSCTRLTNITIPNSVTSICNYAFVGCTGLASVTLGNSVTSIGKYAFSNCTGLTNITIPDTVTSIGDDAFYNCTGLTSITVDSGNTTYNDGNGSNCIIETSTNTLIYGCKNTIIPDSVTSIGYNAFAYCTGLISITIPDSVTSIGSSAFSSCTGLTNITIPDSVTSIGSSAFSSCTGLTSITIPSSVTKIGDYAFYHVFLVNYSGTATGAPWYALNYNTEIVYHDTEVLTASIDKNPLTSGQYSTITLSYTESYVYVLSKTYNIFTYVTNGTKKDEDAFILLWNNACTYNNVSIPATGIYACTVMDSITIKGIATSHTYYTSWDEIPDSKKVTFDV